jgi:hypothetical protein
MCQRLYRGGVRRWLRRWIASRTGAEFVDDLLDGGRSFDARPGRTQHPAHAARVDAVETV